MSTLAEVVGCNGSPECEQASKLSAVMRDLILQLLDLGGFAFAESSSCFIDHDLTHCTLLLLNR
jgi:hypothetical protein